MPEQAVQDIVYSPNDVGNLVIKTIADRKAQPGTGVRLGIPSVDKNLLPLRPGDLVTVTGRPSNYKSGLMTYWARHVAKSLANDDTQSNKVVVYVTWEMAIEEIGIYDLAASSGLVSSELFQGRCSDDELETLKVAAFKRAMTPIWLIGHSIERRKKRPSLTLSNVAKALNYIEDMVGLSPAIIFLDYLQQMEAERKSTSFGDETRRMDIFDNVRRCKDMALAMACPVVVGVQAGRQVDAKDWKLPGMGDQQESSNIEQTADKMISVWYPKMTEPIGEPLIKCPELIVNENLLIMALVKQRGGPAGMQYKLYVDPQHNDIADLQA